MPRGLVLLALAASGTACHQADGGAVGDEVRDAVGVQWFGRDLSMFVHPRIDAQSCDVAH